MVCCRGSVAWCAVVNICAKWILKRECLNGGLCYCAFGGSDGALGVWVSECNSAAAEDAHWEGLTAIDSLPPCLPQSEVATTLRGFERERVDEVELDLRGNLGGLVSQGVETARLFLEGESPRVLRQTMLAVSQSVHCTMLHSLAQPGHQCKCGCWCAEGLSRPLGPSLG